MACAACGARSGLPSDGQTPVSPDGGEGGPAAVDACVVAPLCADNTRGTWRLEDQDHRPAGYFFTFNGRPTCNTASTSFLLIVPGSERNCSRNGGYALQENTATVFRGSADNLGGTYGGACGGEPTRETVRFELRRSSCDRARYDLVVHDSAPNSPYERSLTATRCRCDIGWEPCAQALPVDPCAP